MSLDNARKITERLFGAERMKMLNELMDMLRPQLGESPERWLGASEVAELILTLVKEVPKQMREKMGMVTGEGDDGVVNPMVLLLAGLAISIYEAPETEAARRWKETRN